MSCWRCKHFLTTLCSSFTMSCCDLWSCSILTRLRLHAKDAYVVVEAPECKLSLAVPMWSIIICCRHTSLHPALRPAKTWGQCCGTCSFVAPHITWQDFRFRSGEGVVVVWLLQMLEQLMQSCMHNIRLTAVKVTLVLYITLCATSCCV